MDTQTDTEAQTVSPTTTRAAFHRAGKRLAEQGILFHMSQPTCCRSCAEFLTYDNNTEAQQTPSVFGFRIDGKMNDRRMFSSYWHRDWPEYLGWENESMPEGEFLVAVARALMAEGFTVTIPENSHKSITIRYNKEVE